MYTLYFLPDACSLATQAILHELKQPVDLVHKQDADDYDALNLAGTVPVLVDQNRVLTEGGAILLYLLDKHQNTLIAQSGDARQQAIENLLFANASMHPAYGRLFFIQQHISDEQAKAQAYEAAARGISKLWTVIERKLGDSRYLGGENPSPADFMLAVYSRWGQVFPVDITIGSNTSNMLDRVMARDSFRLALQREDAYQPVNASVGS